MPLEWGCLTVEMAAISMIQKRIYSAES